MRLVRLFALCCTLLVPAAAATAQPGDRADRMIERRVDRLTATLGLSDGQAEQVRTLLHQRASEARQRADEVRRALDVRCGSPGSRPEAEQRTCVRRALEELRVETPHERMRRENAATALRIRALLTPTQATRFDAMVREERARFERRIPGGAPADVTQTRPGGGRPGGGTRPGMRPGGGRPGEGTRPGGGSRPGEGTRPGGGHRPGEGNRPGGGERPSGGSGGGRPGGGGGRPSGFAF